MSMPSIEQVRVVGDTVYWSPAPPESDWGHGPYKTYRMSDITPLLRQAAAKVGRWIVGVPIVSAVRRHVDVTATQVECALSPTDGTEDSRKIDAYLTGGIERHRKPQ